MKNKLLPNLLLGIGIPAIGVIWGDKVTTTMSIGAVCKLGYNYLANKNKDWWDSYLTAENIIKEIDSKLKDEKESAEYYQMMREIITKVSYESRDKKRESFLKLAINLTKEKEINIDEKLIYINILDSLSESELMCLYYDYSIIDIKKFFKENSIADFHQISSYESLLSSKGLLYLNSELVKDKINKNKLELDSRYIKTNLGYKFLNFLLGKDNLTYEIKIQLEQLEKIDNNLKKRKQTTL